ncbi:MAG: hypothetical protein M1816_000845 [Peltula sp. TS41687]|nr:MAG: hypothetical protein M1816_000845 [Peltula sp. TS41687]
MVLPMNLDTPGTEVGNATFNPSLDLDWSMEQSFLQSPSRQRQESAARRSRNGHGHSHNENQFKTPRLPLTDRRNNVAGPTSAGPAAHREFTPLLKSVVKSNMARRQSKTQQGGLRTPAVLKHGYQSAEPSPALPGIDSSAVDGGGYTATSFMLHDVEETPMPQVSSSSANSTPLASLPRADEAAVLADGKKVMTLREQENIVNKIEKENFGLKLKIHFLEDALRKAGPGVSEAALKENADLKVDKVTMQKELVRYRKTLASAEREIELYRKQLAEAQGKVIRKHADVGQREELDRLRRALNDAHAEIHGLNEKLQSSDNRHADTDRLRDEISDLEAESREKDRLLEEKDDVMNDLQDEVTRAKNKVTELEVELSSSNEHVQELEQLLSETEEQRRDNQDARKDAAGFQEKIQVLEGRLSRVMEEVEMAREDAQSEGTKRQQAEADLEELRDEMANKSISTRGLSRQFEDKLHTLQDELEDLRATHESLKSRYNQKTQEYEGLQDKLDDVQQKFQLEKEHHAHTLETLQRDRDVALRERTSISAQVSTLRSDLERKIQEKDLLQTRHDALTSESKDLQRELSRTRSNTIELEEALVNERQRVLQGDNAHRDENRAEMRRLNTEIDDMRHASKEREDAFSRERKTWNIERRNLESSLQKAEDQVTSLSHKLQRLEEVEGSLTGREAKLKQTLEKETERHENEEATLKRQVVELKKQIGTRTQVVEGSKVEVEALREQLKEKQREIEAWEDKAQGLEDEIVILQNSIDEENEQAMEEVSIARREIQDLKEKLRSTIEDGEVQRKKLKGHIGDRARLDAYESELNMLKEQISDHERQQDLKEQEKRAAEKTITELRTQIVRLERRVRDAQGESQKPAIGQERKDLAEQLRIAKSEMEDLQLQVSQRDLQVESLKLREKDLRTQLRELRNERSAQTQKAIKATGEVDILQRRYENALAKVAKLETGLEEECRALQRAQRESNRQHQGELKGMSKQIMYMRKRFEREQRFRANLTFMKRYFLMKIHMYDACNKADLRLLREMGVTPDLTPPKRKPSLRVAAHAVIATIRMRKMKDEWQVNVKVKEKLLATFEQTRRRAQRKVGA